MPFSKLNTTVWILALSRMINLNTYGHWHRVAPQWQCFEPDSFHTSGSSQELHVKLSHCTLFCLLLSAFKLSELLQLRGLWLFKSIPGALFCGLELVVAKWVLMKMPSTTVTSWFLSWLSHAPPEDPSIHPFFPCYTMGQSCNSDKPYRLLPLPPILNSPSKWQAQWLSGACPARPCDAPLWLTSSCWISLNGCWTVSKACACLCNTET